MFANCRLKLQRLNQCHTTQSKVRVFADDLSMNDDVTSCPENWPIIAFVHSFCFAKGGGDLGFSLWDSNFCLQDNFFDQSMNRLSNPLFKTIQKKKIISPHYLTDHLISLSINPPMAVRWHDTIDRAPGVPIKPSSISSIDTSLITGREINKDLGGSSTFIQVP